MRPRQRPQRRPTGGRAPSSSQRQRWIPGRGRLGSCGGAPPRMREGSRPFPARSEHPDPAGEPPACPPHVRSAGARQGRLASAENRLVRRQSACARCVALPFLKRAVQSLGICGHPWRSPRG
eukprot:scaffold8867_cov118-Isochrysis_galbana.AAC.10